ncbi:1-acyl-sn-glycerol-3-phosphate acyltransferase [Treponema parvum]|uniref:1-acyl-sn-glycerol-3-phosphate acyltransferase n=1 Tax=Treponema parvum TaxID=138851 RepID=A0A975IF75_9SPIR|nr:1-acyl-sn-glycerol-3-phosphate acyltransferase [Treponema parvum]QTQ14850.1 1-acyl-sn-glycerol-3-phosphate acyltransferase [Treponema parvum]
MALSLRQKYGKYFSLMSSLTKAAPKIDATNVYEEANIETRKVMYSMLKENMLPGTRLENVENFKAFNEAVKSGKRGLILMEHYSNMDLPALIYQLACYKEPWGKELSDRIVAIAGMKLNEENPMVRAWAEGFTRVIIYPSRSLESVENKEIPEEEKLAEKKRARAINLAAMRAIDACKKRGQVILVFPSGTRYRPGKPETKRGLREVDSYLRMFDVMILVSINGNCLRLDPENTEDMLADLVYEDIIIQASSPVIECKKFREDILNKLPKDDPDPKQKVVNEIMSIFDRQHDEIEKIREKEIEKI